MDGSPLADLDVYRYGGRCVLDLVSPYLHSDPIHDYPFTYPPFAALVMVPLALLPGGVAGVLWTAISVGCLAGTIVLVRRAYECPTHVWLVAALCVASVALEPVLQNFWFGQINLILMLGILVDVVRPDRRTAGILLGIAAGIKLTPLVFVVMLVLIGRRAAAAQAAVTFAATLLIGWLAVPESSVYWGERLLDPTRVGPPSLAHNQSVSGALTRLLDGPPPTLLWLLVAGPIAAATVLIAAAWWRRGDRVLGAGLGAIAMLLASPISWSHHWVWAVPIGLALWERSRVAAGLWVGVFAARPMLWPPWGQKREFDWAWYEHLYGNAYLLAALVLTGASIPALRANSTTGDGHPPSLSQLPVP